MGLRDLVREQKAKEEAARRNRAEPLFRAKDALEGGLSYPEVSPARLFAAVQRVVASLGYGVAYADAASRTLSFATGASRKSFSGQEMSATVTTDLGGVTTLHFGGRRTQTGLARNQVYDWGEKRGIAARVIDAVDGVLPRTPEPSDGAPPSASPPDSVADELERLADLHQRGVLDEDEFRKAKARLLGS
jgi:hypothetical protein